MAAMVAALVAIVVYANAVENGFAYDDVKILVEDQSLHRIENLPDVLLRPYWANHELGREFGLWRPVTVAALALQWSAGGGEPALFHAVNVLLHAGVTALVVWLIVQLVSVPAAFLGGLIFAVHPLHVEAVANVVGLAELLGAAFFLGACVLFLRRREALAPVHLVAIAGLYLLALLSKEITVTLPAVLLLLDGFSEDIRLEEIGSYFRRRWALYGSLAGVAGAVFAARLHVLGSIANPLPPFGSELLLEVPRIWTVASIWPHYVRLLFFPMELSADYDAGVIDVAVGWTFQGILGVSLALVFLLLALAAWRHRTEAGESTRPVSLGIVWFVIAVLPIANLLFVSGVLLAERTLYLPSVGYCIAAGWALSVMWSRRAALAGLSTVVILVAMGARTWTRTPVWKSTETMAESLVADHPESARAQWILADVFRQQGQPARSLRAYQNVVGAVGDDYRIFMEVVDLLLEEGRWEDANRVATFAFGRRPDAFPAAFRAARARERIGDWQGLLAVTDAALGIEPSNVPVLHLRAVALERLGRPREAAEARRAVIARGESDRWEQWFWLARLEAMAGDTSKALGSLDSARIRALDGDVSCQIDSLATEWSGRSSTGNCRSFAESNEDEGRTVPERGMGEVP